MAGILDRALDHARENRAAVLARLREFVSIPSVSKAPPDRENVEAAAQWLAGHLKAVPLDRVEVTAWTRRLMERYAPPSSARVLVLLPCSARKPYSDSRTHRRIREALSGVPNRAVVHEVVLTSPLGAVPRELERTYPAAQYDIPVSGDWFPDELERMRELVEHIQGRGVYDAVVSHMGDDLPFLNEDASIQRSRELQVQNRTALSNHIRGLTSFYAPSPAGLLERYQDNPGLVHNLYPRCLARNRSRLFIISIN